MTTKVARGAASFVHYLGVAAVFTSVLTSTIVGFVNDKALRESTIRSTDARAEEYGRLLSYALATGHVVQAGGEVGMCGAFLVILGRWAARRLDKVPTSANDIHQRQDRI